MTRKLNRILAVFVVIVLDTTLAFAQTGGGSNGLWLSISAQSPDIVLQWPSQPGEHFQLEHRSALALPSNWQSLATNLPASSNTFTRFIHTNALLAASDFYRVALAPAFAFNWTGTNFTYTDVERTFTGIMLKPAGNGPFPSVIINHGAGGTATGYSLSKAREMSNWGLVCIGPTLTHVAGGETNAVNMGNCTENNARAIACANVLASLAYVDTNRLAIFGHSMGAFASIGDTALLGNRLRTAAITSGGIIPDSAGTTNAAPTVTEAAPVRTPFIMFHCDADPIVPPARSQLFQQLLNTNVVTNQRILYSSNSIPNTTNWHNIHQDAAINADVLTNTYQWFQTHGMIP